MKKNEIEKYLRQTIEQIELMQKHIDEQELRIGLLGNIIIANMVNHEQTEITWDEADELPYAVKISREGSIMKASIEKV